MTTFDGDFTNTLRTIYTQFIRSFALWPVSSPNGHYAMQAKPYSKPNPFGNVADTAL